MYQDEDYFARKDYSVYKKVGQTDSTSWDFKIPHTPDNETIKRPLRCYAFCVSAQNAEGESLLSPLVRGARKPKDAIEALKDMDYNMHFSMCHTKNFGESYIETTYTTDHTTAYKKYKDLGGQYIYNSTESAKSTFEHCVNFSVELHGDSRMDAPVLVDLDPSCMEDWIGNAMNGTIQAHGLYEADLTYVNLLGRIGARTVPKAIADKAITEGDDWPVDRNPSMIIFTYYPQGRNGASETLNLTPDQAATYMRTVGLTDNEVESKKIATQEEIYFDETLEEFWTFD